MKNHIDLGSFLSMDELRVEFNNDFERVFGIDEMHPKLNYG